MRLRVSFVMDSFGVEIEGETAAHDLILVALALSGRLPIMELLAAPGLGG